MNLAEPADRVLVTGASGLLGGAMSHLLGGKTILFDHARLDIANIEAVETALDLNCPKVVINCAAATDVDRCESDHAYADTANALGPKILAQACAARKIGLVHISTDFVFDGMKRSPYVEEDRPNPLNYYGQSKLRGEQAVLAVESFSTYVLVVRTSWVFGCGGPNSSSFPDKVLSWASASTALRVASDQWGSPTYAPFLARGIIDLYAAGGRGLMHLAGSGCTSRFELAAELLTSIGADVELVEDSVAKFASTAPRPRFSCLDCSKAAALGVALPPWQEGIRQYAGRKLAQ